jgi:hypothetical protein
MNINEAMIIAAQSTCGMKLKSTHFCNENSGTWWIDLDVTQKGCSPACVVDVEKKTAEINWRCTGLIVPTETAAAPANASANQS